LRRSANGWPDRLPRASQYAFGEVLHSSDCAPNSPTRVGIAVEHGPQGP
jgi:hypothetical protein